MTLDMLCSLVQTFSKLLMYFSFNCILLIWRQLYKVNILRRMISTFIYSIWNFVLTCNKSLLYLWWIVSVTSTAIKVACWQSSWNIRKKNSVTWRNSTVFLDRFWKIAFCSLFAIFLLVVMVLLVIFTKATKV